METQSPERVFVVLFTNRQTDRQATLAEVEVELMNCKMYRTVLPEDHKHTRLLGIFLTFACGRARIAPRPLHYALNLCRIISIRSAIIDDCVAVDRDPGRRRRHQ